MKATGAVSCALLSNPGTKADAGSEQRYLQSRLIEPITGDRLPLPGWTAYSDS